MSKKPETKIEDGYCEWLQNSKYKALALKLVLFAGRGFPDRTIICNGKVFFIEFKAGKNTQQKEQKFWQKLITRTGCNYYVCYSKEEAIQITRKEMESP